MLSAATVLLSAVAQLQAPGEPPAMPTGIWRAWLESPGGQLPFGLEFGRTTTGEWTAAILNGPERIVIPEVQWTTATPQSEVLDTLELSFPHYDSVIRARPALDGSMLSGEWIKTRGKDRETRMPFRARVTKAAAAQDFLPLRFQERPARPGQAVPSLAQRYAVKFESSDDPAIGIFHTLGGDSDSDQAPRGVAGTFLTTTGDYRYLAGSIDAQGLRLSCFDGAHAFLFHARAVPGRQVHGGRATLAGDFWSRDTWHESWRAEPDADIQLPDPWKEIGLKPEEERPDWRSFEAAQLDGTQVALGALQPDAKARLLVLFGSWCPNCHDEHRYLKELHARYSKQGLAITSLGFELGGDRARDLAQLRRYQEAMELPWDLVLVSSSADKKLAAQAFPLVTAVKSYPTTLFIDAEGTIRAVHSGFSGPATGEAYERLRRSFEEKIQGILRDAD